MIGGVLSCKLNPSFDGIPGLTVALEGGCTSLMRYQIAAGCISAVAIMLYLAAVTFQKEKVPDKALLWFSAVLALWWFIAVIALTFPVQNSTTLIGTLGTPYFAIWSSFAFSCVLLHAEWEQFRSVIVSVQDLEQNSQSTFIVLVAACVEIIAVIFPLAQVGTSTPAIIGLVFGLLIALVAFLLLKFGKSSLESASKPLSVGLVVLAVANVIATTLTIRGPFLNIGNGFFAVWLALMGSFYSASDIILSNRVFAGLK